MRRGESKDPGNAVAIGAAQRHFYEGAAQNPRCIVRMPWGYNATGAGLGSFDSAVTCIPASLRMTGNNAEWEMQNANARSFASLRMTGERQTGGGLSFFVAGETPALSRRRR